MQSASGTDLLDDGDPPSRMHFSTSLWFGTATPVSGQAKALGANGLNWKRLRQGFLKSLAFLGHSFWLGLVAFVTVPLALRIDTAEQIRWRLGTCTRRCCRPRRRNTDGAVLHAEFGVSARVVVLLRVDFEDRVRWQRCRAARLGADGVARVVQDLDASCLPSCSSLPFSSLRATCIDSTARVRAQPSGCKTK